MSKPSLQQPGQQGSSILEQLPERLLLKVLTNSTSFFCLQNLRITCRSINELLTSDECRAARASKGVDSALVIVSRQEDYCEVSFQFHVLVNGEWRRTPWNLERDAEELKASVVTQSANGEHLLFIGNNSSCGSSLININTGQRHTLPPHWIKRCRPGVCHLGHCTILAGGFSGDNHLAEVEVFNPASNTWKPLQNMPHASFGATAGVIGQKLYVAGGTNEDELTCLQIYDTTLNTWELGPEMPECLDRTSGAVVGDKLYITGRSWTTNSFVCVYFIPESMEWKSTASIGPALVNYHREHCYAVNHNGSLWILYVPSDNENYWKQLQDDGEWSRVPSSIAPKCPDHQFEYIEAIVSAVFKP